MVYRPRINVFLSHIQKPASERQCGRRKERSANIYGGILGTPSTSVKPVARGVRRLVSNAEDVVTFLGASPFRVTVACAQHALQRALQLTLTPPSLPQSHLLRFFAHPPTYGISVLAHRIYRTGRRGLAFGLRA